MSSLLLQAVSGITVLGMLLGFASIALVLASPIHMQLEYWYSDFIDWIGCSEYDYRHEQRYVCKLFQPVNDYTQSCVLRIGNISPWIWITIFAISVITVRIHRSKQKVPGLDIIYSLTQHESLTASSTKYDNVDTSLCGSQRTASEENSKEENEDLPKRRRRRSNNNNNNNDVKTDDVFPRNSPGERQDDKGVCIDAGGSISSIALRMPPKDWAATVKILQHQYKKQEDQEETKSDSDDLGLASDSTLAPTENDFQIDDKKSLHLDSDEQNEEDNSRIIIDLQKEDKNLQVIPRQTTLLLQALFTHPVSWENDHQKINTTPLHRQSMLFNTTLNIHSTPARARVAIFSEQRRFPQHVHRQAQVAALPFITFPRGFQH